MVHACVQAQLEYFEAIDGEEPYERNSEDLYAGGGQYRRAVERTPIEHFPQLWCNNGSYSVYGQVRFSQVLLQHAQPPQDACTWTLSGSASLCELPVLSRICCPHCPQCPVHLLCSLYNDIILDFIMRSQMLSHYAWA